MNEENRGWGDRLTEAVVDTEMVVVVDYTTRRLLVHGSAGITTLFFQSDRGA